MKKKPSQNIQILLSSSKTGFFTQFCFFLFVLFVFVFPSIFNTQGFALAKKPKILFDTLYFFSNILIIAMFEELIYRVYIPFQLKTLYNFFMIVKKNKIETIIFSLISNIFFALAHSYLGIYNVIFAFIMGNIFSLIYEIIKLKKNGYYAFFAVSLFHFFYNAIAFAILIA